MNCSKELFSGISRAQLVCELKAERDVLTACVSNCLPLVRSHFERELRDVVAFIEYLAAAPHNATQRAAQNRAAFGRIVTIGRKRRPARDVVPNMNATRGNTCGN